MLAARTSWIAFRHALLAEAVYADLLPGELSALHRAYLRRSRDDPSLGSHAQLAHHALRAHDLPTALRGVLARPPGRRREVLAPAEELRHLETVLQLWDAVPDRGRTDRPGPHRRRRWLPRPRPAEPANRPGPSRSRGAALEPSADPARSCHGCTPAARTYLIDDGREQDALELAEPARSMVLDADGTVARIAPGCWPRTPGRP